MRPIDDIRTLVYYDGVQLFEGRDSIGGHHVGVLVDDSGAADRYLVAGVAPERLRQFRIGAVDLRTLFLEAGPNEWLLADVADGFRAPLTPFRPDNPGACRDLLPDEGFVLHDGPGDDAALREARARGNVVLELRVDPPEAAGAPRIRATTLAGLLEHTQLLAMHAYRKAVPAPRRAPDGHLMNVVAPAPGSSSFGILLEAARAPDLFGSGELARGLERMDTLFQCAADPRKAAERLKPHSGRLAGSWIALMRFLSECDSGLRYAWAEPDFDAARRGGGSAALARRLAGELSKSASSSVGKVDVAGRLDKVDVESGRWRLATADGPRTGKLRDSGPSLGLVIGMRYVFHCSEDIEIVHATGREKNTLCLDSIETA